MGQSNSSVLADNAVNSVRNLAYDLPRQRSAATCAARARAPCFESNRGANKKAIVAPSSSQGTDLFTEHPAIAIYFIDCHLLWLLSLSTSRIKQQQVKIVHSCLMAYAFKCLSSYLLCFWRPTKNSPDTSLNLYKYLLNTCL